MRQSTHRPVPVNYASVGATKDPDLLAFPPKGYIPDEFAARLGSGNDRFEAAATTLMTWGMQRASGIRVTDIDPAPTDVTDYRGALFDHAGMPVPPPGRPREAVYTDDGTPYITSGTSVVLRIPVGPVAVKAPTRVIYVVDEPDRVGFAYGTLAGHPQSGEESFIVSRQDDGSVWLTIRRFWRPSSPVWRLGYPVLVLLQSIYTKRYLRVLHPARGN
ncbi:DUF1990 family protein [Planctomonas psychrotolerans]|uniref:DUF1990 family protein n=1 Tax=Planctomonas psychrotolerans TaxID=2528712 RepID=UPI001239604C|nr:DUF1990 domain-containing protein [Planctomonas psychrotolerans]